MCVCVCVSACMSSSEPVELVGLCLVGFRCY